MYIPANLKTVSWKNPKHEGAFIPRGNPSLYTSGQLRTGVRGNPFESFVWEKDKSGKRLRRKISYAARLIVGLRVGRDKEWPPEDVIAHVEKMRKKQTGDPSMSIVAQKGIYKHQDKSLGVIHENSLQIVIFDTDTTPIETFENQILAIAESICKKFKQESVIVEYQNGGVAYDLGMVTP